MDSTPTGSVTGKNRNAQVTTPVRQTATIGLPSSRPSSVHTPLSRAASRDLVSSVRRGLSASGGRRMSNAPTPHAKAARLALHQRRHAIFSPDRNRRRSLMEQRETPRDLLRDLSRALASKSKPIASSPQDASPSNGPSYLDQSDDDDDDDLPIDRPHLSMSLDSDDNFDLQPGQSSGIYDDNTVRSAELPRRALSEQPRPSLSFFGNARVSDFFGNDNQPSIQDGGRQSDFFPGLLEELQTRSDAEDLSYSRIDGDETRRSPIGRVSDFGFQLPPEMEEATTFVLAGPPPESSFDSSGLHQPSAAMDANDELLETAARHDEADATDSDASVADLDQTHDQPPEPKAQVRKARKRMSRHGIEYPPLPPSFIKKMTQRALQSTGLSNHRVSADTLAALTQASEWFFEQLGDDLGAYANHAKRKTIEESDVMTLMRRQRQISSSSTTFSLAQKHLPRELLQDLRMSVPQPARKRRVKHDGHAEVGME